MKIDLGTVEISKEDWELIKQYFTREEAIEHMRSIAVADLRNEALGRESIEDLS